MNIIAYLGLMLAEPRICVPVLVVLLAAWWLS